MTKTQLQQKIEALGDQLDKEKRDYQAFAEWFICESRGHASMSLDVFPLSSEALLTVTVHGMGRACGGVAVVSHGESYRDFPRFLDDVIAEWSADSCSEMRDAARILSSRRDEYDRVAA